MGYYMTYLFWFLSFSSQLSSGCRVKMLIKDGFIMKSHMQSALQSLNILLLWSRNGTPDARSLAHRRQSREHFLISGLGRTISPKNFMYLAAQGEGARSRARA